MEQTIRSQTMWDFYLKTIPQRYRCGLFPHVYSSQWCVKRIILVFSHAAILAALRCFKYTQQCFELNGKCRHANIRAQTMLTCWRLAVMMWKQTTPHGLNASNRGIEAGCFAVLLHHFKELRDHLTQGLVTSQSYQRGVAMVLKSVTAYRGVHYV